MNELRVRDLLFGILVYHGKYPKSELNAAMRAIAVAAKKADNKSYLDHSRDVMGNTIDGGCFQFDKDKMLYITEPGFTPQFMDDVFYAQIKPVELRDAIKKTIEELRPSSRKGLEVRA